MIPVRELCRRRWIRKVDLSTPMLIPSFSSKGFPDVSGIFSATKEHISDVMMISSYDIFYANLDGYQEAPSLLFVDSGGYEARQDYDASDLRATEYCPREWTRAYHEKVLTELDVLSPLVFISFDEAKNDVPIPDQLGYATILSSRFPQAASDFLVKPYNKAYIDVDQVALDLNEYHCFDLLGFTEKELGSSLVERLHNIVQIRQVLTRAGMDTPVHVFGCLDPLAVQLFYLCGADVFDGLSWLRFAFHNSMAVYRNNWAALAGHAELSDESISQWSWIENLATLARLQHNMSQYVSCFDPSHLEMDQALAEKILNAVGVTMDQEEG